MSIRKALGAVKDQTSISLTKFTASPDLDVAVLRATSHDAAPADDRHVAQVLRLTSSSRAHVAACVAALARRLARTRDYVVAAKCLALVHRLLADGDPLFRHEVIRPDPTGRRAGEPLLALAEDFRDEAHAGSWDHSAFVRAHAAYLDARARFLVALLPPPRAVRFADDPITAPSLPSSNNDPSSSVRDMDADAVLTRSRQLRDLLDRVLACRPTGAATRSRVVLAALFPLLKDSLQLRADAYSCLAVLLDRFFDMEYAHCVKAFEAHVAAARQFDQLLAFHDWCKDLGVSRASSDFPRQQDVNRIDDSLLETLEQFLRERGRAGHSDHFQSTQQQPQQQRGRGHQDDDPEQAAEYDGGMNRVKALPAPPPPPQSEPTAAALADDRQLVDLREETADEQGTKLALALLNAPPPPQPANINWVAFPSDDDDKVTTSAWQTPAAEPGRADWELALVEAASALPRQEPALGGGLDPLLLGGMYDQGAVRRHVAAQASASGSASSVAALPGGRSVLALPAPDGTLQTVVGGGDPFAASLAVPPPAYVQMAEMERKQQLLLQEQHMWAQYRQGGMQGQPAMMPSYGMPAAMASYNQVGGYY